VEWLTEKNMRNEVLIRRERARSTTCDGPEAGLGVQHVAAPRCAWHGMLETRMKTGTRRATHSVAKVCLTRDDRWMYEEAFSEDGVAEVCLE
jgi:hypothetical protein